MNEEMPRRDQTAQIRENIEQTRAEMSGTIGEIQEKLSPSHLKDQVKEQVRVQIDEVKSALRAATIGKVENMIRNTGSAFNDTRRSLWETIKDNPVPASLAGIGLAWLFMNRRSAKRRLDEDWAERRWNEPYSRDFRGELGNGGGETEGRGGEMLRNVQQKAGDVADQAKEKASEWVEQGRYQAQRVEERFQGWMESNPIGLGVVALAVGTAIGLAIPSTQKENEMMGEARDAVMDKAQELASQAVDKAKQVATQGSGQSEGAQPSGH